MISVKRMQKSFKHAGRGLKVAFKTEQSFRLQVVAAIVVVVLAAIIQVRLTHWIILLLMIGSVLVLELINTIFEHIIDTVKPRLHPAVKDIKDIMAGAVLVASVTAAAIGTVIFSQYIF